jgi:hypothetical protein
MSTKRTLSIVLLTCAALLVPGAAPGSASPLQSEELAPSLTAAASRLGGEIQISLPTSPECDRYKPSVAYNWVHDEYLVVWHNTWPSGHRDIYARRVSASGQLLSWFSVSAGANDRAQPAVAYNATNDEYLVVWMYNANGDGSTYDIWGRTIAWNGAYQNPEFRIITWPNRTFWTPRVAWNSTRNEYLVVWSAYDATTLTPTDVAHALLAANGSKLYGTIISSTEEPHQADVTYNATTDEYLVVWRRMWTSTDGDIRAARIDGGSAVVVNPPGAFTVNAVTEDQLLPAVTTNQQNRYVVVWQHAYPGPCCDWDIRGQELDMNGYLVGSEFSIAYTTDDETSPAIVARPGPVRDYLVVWQRSTSTGEQIWAYHRRDDNIEVFEVAATAFWDQESPAVAWGQVASLIVYEGDSQSDPRHIYGRLWWPEAVYLPLVLRNSP